jgi:hypothetical protein
MYAAAFIGNKIIDLAGWDQGPGAETSNLSISYDSQFQSVSYVGGTWGRQFWRPGTMATVSFDSRFDFKDFSSIDYQRQVTQFLLKLPGYFSNQSDCTFKICQPFGYGNGIRDRQVERATAVGTVTTAGTANLVVTYNGMDGSPDTVSFSVAAGDTASDWAEKARSALSRAYDIASYFSVSGTGTNITLTRRSSFAEQDNTFNIAINKGTSVGIVDNPTSVNSQATGSWSLMSLVTFFDANVSVAASQVGTSVLLNTSVTGRLVAP